MATPIPSHHSMVEKIDYGSELVPAPLFPDIRDVATPNFVRRRRCERSKNHIRDIRPLHRCLLVGMRAGLLADQFHLGRNGTTLLALQTPLYGAIPVLNGCPDLEGYYIFNQPTNSQFFQEAREQFHLYRVFQLGGRPAPVQPLG